MESLSETTWDVIICGTGLQQSLLALALSRSDKKILHVDPNEYYGGSEAALTLQEADAWAAEIARASPDAASIFSSAIVTRPPHAADAAGLSNPRAYALSLSPQLIYASSTLLSQLVSSRAYRQLEFLAVGSFFVCKHSQSSATPVLTRIPSTREDVFSSTDLSTRAKRQLMKFLKLVLSYQDEASLPQWHEYADRSLSDFLGEKMALDDELRAYITTLTLSLDGRITTRDGLGAVHRHLTSMGLFGPGFAAVYPKWGGGSEIAQVACRAGAVGGGVYMLGTGIKCMGNDGLGEDLVELELTDGTIVKTRALVRGSQDTDTGDVTTVSRMMAVIASPLSWLFETTVESVPTPAVAVIALPPGAVGNDDGTRSKYPIYAVAHSSDTGECPTGQSIFYLSTIRTSKSKELLEKTTISLLTASASKEGSLPKCLYQLYYEQKSSTSGSLAAEGRVLDFLPPLVSLTFNDAILGPVQEAWRRVVGEAAEGEDVQYMVFADREGVGDEDDY